MVSQYLLDKLVGLVKQEVVSINDVKIQEYKDSTIAEFKNEVASGIITQEEYKQYIGLAYQTK